MLLKERTLDEAPRPPKKAMDYSSSSEEVESSEDDEEESNGEPSEGSRDTPGTRYGGALGIGALPYRKAPERNLQVGWVRGLSGKCGGKWFLFSQSEEPWLSMLVSSSSLLLKNGM